MDSGNSSESSKIDAKTKVDGRIDSRDRNIIGEGSSIGGYTIVGDKRDKSSNTLSSNTKSNNTNTKSNNKGGCREKKIDIRRRSGDTNVIGADSHIDGNAIIGSANDNSDKIDDNPVLDNNNNTKNDNIVVMQDILKARLDLSFSELDFRVDSGDTNIIRANCHIQGDAIVGDGSGNNTMNSYEKGKPQQQTHQQQQGGGNNSNNNSAPTTVTTKSAPTTGR